MKANELRIGNLVYNSHGDIHAIGCNCFHRFRYPSMDGNPSGFKPIPLTEEILLKCGFSCTEESGTSKGFSIGENIVTYDYLVYLTWLKRIDGKGLDPYPFYRNGRHIVKYLHQLQNLYYALTGEELEVKM